jgi:hypothetical protein
MASEQWVWLPTVRSGLVRADRVVSIRSGRGLSSTNKSGVFVETVNASDEFPEIPLVFTEDDEAADAILRDVLEVLAGARVGIVQYDPVKLGTFKGATNLGRASSNSRTR